MRMLALAAAGLVAATALAPMPVEAQRYGYGDRGWRGGDRDGGWGRDRGWRGDGDRGWRGDRRWRGDRWDRGWNRGWNRGWRGNRWRGRGRTVCRWVDGYYGPQRRCFRVWR
ncbi:hypothetical protein M0208_17410 [Sphingomonas sp. SUN019]|uniref:hypothetical protein n=1 Tax=Sphingomonas sp. SUN019 TaxID=2937788 RepID=UPI002164A596|nr:hypothetical protein [Sphingomonas sp. SUN019]UVO52202.1 hypothetical protein M0208_17410 [Sphingomonas sp. SUN019]